MNVQLKVKSVFHGGMVGLAAGLVTVLYRFAISRSEKILKFFIHLVSENILYLGLFILVLTVGALVSYFLVKWEPMISGSGIPQTKGELDGVFEQNWLRVLTAKFFGGALAIICGLSLGREGPSIQLGAMTGKGCSKVVKNPSLKKQYLTCGASAGLAAAFNAPIAGVLFAIEELHKGFSTELVISTLSATFIADFVSQCFFGSKPSFDLGVIVHQPLSTYWALILFGLLLGALGAFYNFLMTLTHRFYDRLNRFKIIIPFALSAVLIVFLPDALGPGHSFIEKIAVKDMAIGFLLIVFVVKLAFSMLSFCSEVPGGIFLPMLVMGALIGKIFGSVSISLFGLDQSLLTNFIILGMVGFFTAIVRAPITGIVLVFEMTGFSNLLALALVSLSAYTFTELIRSTPVYDYLLDRSVESYNKRKAMEKDSENSQTGKKEKNSIHM